MIYTKDMNLIGWFPRVGKQGNHHEIIIRGEDKLSAVKCMMYKKGN